jgi:hypothetical protein
VTSKKEREYASITIDDGTETIQVKAWDSDPQKLELLKQARRNVLTLVVGRVRQIGNEVYVDPEIVRELPDPNYMTLHRLERLRSIMKLSGVAHPESRAVEAPPSAEVSSVAKPPAAKSEEPKEHKQKKGFKSKITSSLHSAPASPRQRILAFIKDNAGDHGVSTQEIAEFFKSSGSVTSDIDLLVIDLLQERKIREVRVGVYMPAD